MDRPLSLWRLMGAILLILLPLSAHISWMGDYEAARRLALMHHKDLFVVLVKKDCMECRELIRRIGSDPHLQRNIAAQYIGIILIAESATSYPIELYYSTHFPTLFFVNAESEIFLSPPSFSVDCVKKRMTEEVN